MKHYSAIVWGHLGLWANIFMEGHEMFKMAYLANESPEMMDIMTAMTKSSPETYEPPAEEDEEGANLPP